jgi:alkylation response protein AidB-like acyl-CoA dehydrogenase
MTVDQDQRLPSVDLRYGELEEELRATVQEMLARLSPPAQVLARCESGDAYDAKLWRTMAVEMGLAGLAMPERYGGAGASLREAAVVLEELGRAVTPVPYLGSAVVATTALLAAGDEPLLTDLAAGAATVALAVPFGTAPGPDRAPPVVRAAGGGLTGTIRAVADALAADTLLVPATDGLYAVPAGAEGVSRHPMVSLDLTRPLCDLTLVGVTGRRVAAGPDGHRAAAAGLAAGAALLASEQLGLAQWCLDTTVEHVRTRHQFGRPVGSFQALRHRLADLWVELAQARAVARYAAACVAVDHPDTPVAAAVAQAFCGPVAVRAAEECVQLHGGIGFTWEHPAHLYLKRAKSAAIGFGTADRHRAALATLVDLPG